MDGAFLNSYNVKDIKKKEKIFPIFNFIFETNNTNSTNLKDIKSLPSGFRKEIPNLFIE